MRYKLIIGDCAYSSWSLRGWLLFERFGLRAEIEHVAFSAGNVRDQLQRYAPARTVPTLVVDDTTIIGDSLAMAEELASRHPELGFWPEVPAARATARWMAAEMHAGFAALRQACPMNLTRAYCDTAPDAAVKEDLERIEALWHYARKFTGAPGPWLCGRYSVADVFFAPVAARIAGYALPVGEHAQTYVSAHLSDPAFRRWRAMSLAQGTTLERYAKPFAQTAWPGPAPRDARLTQRVDAENAACPYSGRPTTHYLEMENRVFGFCNAFCRDKTLADPDAWPDFMMHVAAG